MADREKVIQGLECCGAQLDCDNCPYDELNESDAARIGRVLYEQAGRDTGLFDIYCQICLHKDALELLKAER